MQMMHACSLEVRLVVGAAASHPPAIGCLVAVPACPTESCAGRKGVLLAHEGRGNHCGRALVVSSMPMMHGRHAPPHCIQRFARYCRL